MTYNFRNELQQAPWSLLETAKCVDDFVFLWERLFNDVADTHAPMKKRPVKGQWTPWITNKPIEIRRDSDYHHRKARISGSRYHWNMYKKLRNYANREERQLKSTYFCNLIDDSKSDSSRMWKALKQVLPSKDVKEVQGIKSKKRVFTKPGDIAQTLNKHVSTIRQKLARDFKRGNTTNIRFNSRTN